MTLIEDKIAQCYEDYHRNDLCSIVKYKRLYGIIYIDITWSSKADYA